MKRNVSIILVVDRRSCC